MGQHVRHFQKEAAFAAHQDTILAAPILPEEEHPPVSHSYGYMEQAGQSMELHQHPSYEFYLVLEGRGFVEIDGQREPVGPVSYTHLDVYKRQPQDTGLGQQSLQLFLGLLGADSRSFYPLGTAAGTLRGRYGRIAAIVAHHPPVCPMVGHGDTAMGADDRLPAVYAGKRRMIAATV